MTHRGLRISTTTLEAFRLYQTADWFPEQDLINTITGVRVETGAMRLGTAFHAVLEDPDRYRVFTGYSCDGFSFPDATMRPALALIDRSGPFEVKSQATLLGHTVVAKADQIVGARIYEHKTTTNSFDADKYLASFQWRFMAAIFQPVSVTYRVFLLEEPREGIVGLKGMETVTVYPYPALRTDCETLLRQFLDYVTTRGLTAHLERAGTSSDPVLVGG